MAQTPEELFKKALRPLKPSESWNIPNVCKEVVKHVELSRRLRMTIADRGRVTRTLS